MFDLFAKMFGDNPNLQKIIGKARANCETILTCPAYKQKNRVADGKENPRCGKCGLPLSKG